MGEHGDRSSENRLIILANAAVEAVGALWMLCWSGLVGEWRRRARARVRASTEGERFAQAILIASLISGILWGAIFFGGYYFLFR